MVWRRDNSYYLSSHDSNIRYCREEICELM